MSVLKHLAALAIATAAALTPIVLTGATAAAETVPVSCSAQSNCVNDDTWEE